MRARRAVLTGFLPRSCTCTTYYYNYDVTWTNIIHVHVHAHAYTSYDVLKMLTTDTTLLLVYPNFIKLAQVCLTLPISTADCERAFSTMRRIKTRLRSEMNNTTLNHCMRISIESPKLQDFDFDSAVHTWSGLWNRRIFQ